jgi:hypothetical protein
MTSSAERPHSPWHASRCTGLSPIESQSGSGRDRHRGAARLSWP